ncbi:leucine-rich repeat and immunoglobulin-like domain-containing nogo receptor-interacting protein 4b [Pimephales promelas]|uniref:leucine-rich repeat and immunoglobulin-like domain-containing nogo receptor-interacting protein 4b n=1 Tax=Pimephales promelas TaxID=90988 RepID=UPI001955A435|nr:leucine-rich repeat and immunoglobulin-like domain-containing nogo receptor-interacting protein 4b [Pimephales promelas]XP_039535304.1 leucine-rich repeat and immunoglobulin-like domain-containing nogo receptor-interacting protein 4b [Pimephales promelas]KAG1947960.1 leucine-rich repeat and immunoglobulin-like domain-containing nogo receptor-interacting protein [Pimephales promelas]
MFMDLCGQRGAWSVLLLWCLNLSAADLTCPQKCACYRDTLEVNCSSRHLTGVPEVLLSNAKRLDLSRNQLKTLARRQFSGLSKLEDLDLSENIISMIEVETFQGLKNLRYLRIKNNRLKILPVGVFSGLANLQRLDVSENEILVFLDYTFQDMTNLQQLDAGENDLVFISQRAFVGLQALKELNVDRSNLTSIPTEALSQLQSLTKLRLRKLTISALPNNAFRRLHQLRTLQILHWPSLETLNSNSLVGLNLTTLVLSNCNLSSVPYAPLRHLAYLRYLDLSYNPITSIQGHLLGELLRLQELHLVGGSLLRIEPAAFRGLVHFRLLNVSSNRLTTLEESVFHSVGNLQTLRLDRNPLACDCRLLWVVRRRRRLDFDGRQPSCSAQNQHKKAFRDFSEADLPVIFTCRQAQIVTRQLQDASVVEGMSIRFDCRAEGYPSPSISWMSAQQTALSSVGRIRVLANGSLEVRYAQVQDSGTYLCTAANAAGNDSISMSLQVEGLPQNRTASYFSDEGWMETSLPPSTNSSTRVSNPYPFDAKTLIIATTMGFLSFLSSVAICFVFMFFWSQSKGQIKHTATIDFVPRSSMGGGGDGGDTGRFTMKLI